MKKFLFRLVTVFLITCVALSIFVSCDGSGISEIPSSENTTPSDLLGEKVDYSVKLKSTQNMTSNIQIGYKTRTGGTPTVNDKSAIMRSVSRTAVAIETEYGKGSGVIIDIDEGKDYGELENNIFYILTCHHVISTGGDVTVYVADSNYSYSNENYTFKGKIGGTIKAEQAVALVGGDVISDIALLKLFVKSNTVAQDINTNAKAQFMNINEPNNYKLELYETVFAVGNPTGELPGSVSEGVVNPMREGVAVGGVGYMNLMQISVAINPGNSGGGLFNMYGELVGITNAGDDAYQQINFAIPLTTNADGVIKEDRGVLSIVKQLLGSYMASNGANYGYISGRWAMGFTMKLNVSGISFDKVVDKSLASVAGAKAGDELVSVEFYDVFDKEDVKYDDLGVLILALSCIKSTLKEGDSFTINVSREPGCGSTIVALKFKVENCGSIVADTCNYNGIKVEA